MQLLLRYFLLNNLRHWHDLVDTLNRRLVELLSFTKLWASGQLNLWRDLVLGIHLQAITKVEARSGTVRPLLTDLKSRLAVLSLLRAHLIISYGTVQLLLFDDIQREGLHDVIGHIRTFYLAKLR